MKATVVAECILSIFIVICQLQRCLLTCCSLSFLLYFLSFYLSRFSFYSNIQYICTENIPSQAPLYNTTHLTIWHNINTQHSIPWSADSLAYLWNLLIIILNLTELNTSLMWPLWLQLSTRRQPNKNHKTKKFLTTIQGTLIGNSNKYVTLTHHNKKNTIGFRKILGTEHTIQNKKNFSTGLYKLQCNDCPMLYIFQTGRSFQTRYTDHVTTNKINILSTYAQIIIIPT